MRDVISALYRNHRHCRRIWLCRHGPAQKVQALHVVHEVGHADLDPRSGEADGSDEQIHAIFLFGEDVLDPGLIRVSEIWDSRKQFEAYGQRLTPILVEAGIDVSGETEIFEVHNIWKR